MRAAVLLALLVTIATAGCAATESATLPQAISPATAPVWFSRRIEGPPAFQVADPNVPSDRARLLVVEAGVRALGSVGISVLDVAADFVPKCGSMECPTYALLFSGLIAASDTARARSVGFAPQQVAEIVNGIRHPVTGELRVPR